MSYALQLLITLKILQNSEEPVVLKVDYILYLVCYDYYDMMCCTLLMYEATYDQIILSFQVLERVRVSTFYGTTRVPMLLSIHSGAILLSSLHIVWVESSF